MIVVDACAWFPALADPETRGNQCRAILSADADWLAPAHMATEVLRTLQRAERRRILSAATLDLLVGRVVDAPVRYVGPDAGLLAGQWTLRHNISAYDAAYVVLAQRYAVPLVTTDGRLASAATALGVEVRLVPVQG